MDKEPDADILSHGVHQVVAAFPIAIAVTRNSKNKHLVISKPDACCDRKRSSMEPIKSIAFQIMREFPRLAYPGHDSELMGLDAEFKNAFFKRPQNPEISGSRSVSAKTQRSLLPCRQHSRRQKTVKRN